MDEAENEEENTPAPTGDGHVWLLMAPGSVPARWASRVLPLALVSLAPEEADQILEFGFAQPALTHEEAEVARRAASGMSAEDIAQELHMTPRSVYRRLARLRDRVGAKNSAELAARLSRLGF